MDNRAAIARSVTTSRPAGPDDEEGSRYQVTVEEVLAERIRASVYSTCGRFYLDWIRSTLSSGTSCVP